MSDGIREWQPRYLVQKAPWVGGDPIPTDEPCLVIRAKDHLAVSIMLEYLARYGDAGNPDPAVVSDLRRHLLRLEQWQEDNADLLKWADR